MFLALACAVASCSGLFLAPHLPIARTVSQVNAAATGGKAAPNKKVAARGGADDDQFDDIEIGDDLLPP